MKPHLMMASQTVHLMIRSHGSTLLYMRPNNFIEIPNTQAMQRMSWSN